MSQAIFPISLEIQINSLTQGDQNGVSVASLENESLAFVWESFLPDGSKRAGATRIFDDTLSPISTEAYFDRIDARVSIWELQGGDYFVTREYETRFGQQFSSFGQPSSDQVDFGTSGPRAISPSGIVHTISIEYRESSAESALVLIRTDLEGIESQSPLLLSEYSQKYIWDPQVESLGDGTLLATWTEVRYSGFGEYTRHLVGQQYSETGLTIGNSFDILLVHGIDGPRSFSTSTRLADGNLLFVWSDPDTGGESKIYYQFFAPNGDLVGEKFLVASNLLGEADPNLQVLSLDKNGFIIAWSGISGLTVVQYFDSAGSPFGDVYSLSLVNGESSFAAVDDHRFLTSWTSPRDDESDGSGSEVYGQLLAIDLPPEGDVLIEGDAIQYQVLTVDASGVTDQDGIDETTVAYHWLRNGSAITGATGMSYTLTQDDVGTTVSVRYSYTDGFGVAESVDSATTGLVENVNDAPEGDVLIEGDAIQYQVLTVDASGVTDQDGIDETTVAYHWLRNGSAITGATGMSYTLTQDDVGATVSVRYSYTDGFGVAESVDSNSSETVSPAGLVLLGTPRNDELLGDVGNDTINGLEGNDRLVGGAGNDVIRGGDGSDTMNGGFGDDTLIGGDTSGDVRDVIYAGEGNDSVDAGAGNDLIYGMEGNDTIAGGFGVDELQGQDGDDVITGSAFSDLVFGGAGDDFVNGGFGSDRINGGSGADKFFHVGVEGHGSDWVQDYNAAEGDVLLFGNITATRDDFQVNFAHTENSEGERSGDDAVQEAFVIYRPTGQIMWALVDGEGQSSINLKIGDDVFDLLV